MCVLWGMPYLLIKIAVEELSPPQLVLLRTGMAAVLLLPWAAVRGQLVPVLRHWKPLVVFTLLELAVPWLLLASAERDLSSSLTGLLVAAVPLVAAFAARLGDHADRLDRRRLLGLGVGFAGVAALVGIDVRGGDLVSVGQVAITVVCYAVAPLVVSRWLSEVPATGVTAAALGLTALVYTPFGLPGLEVPSQRVVLAVVVLSLACTVAALLAFFALIAEVGPQRALVITYVNPAVALLLGIVLLSEPLTPGAVVGFPLVLLGCVLATRPTAASTVDEEVLGEPVARP
ncbi:MAG: cyeA [Frankiales bacterium]|jgi:drug/metabolite transporter (DMT)-like permease|nr:cyeA [Frankiales bacterium]